jgi:hypothetical protein
MRKTIFAAVIVAVFGLAVGAEAAKAPALSEKGRGPADLATLSIKGSGSVKGKPIAGSFTAAFTADWGNAATRNGKRCARAGGNVTLSHGPDQLVLTSTGVACRAADGHVSYTGSYTVFSGDGKYESQGVGKGKVTFTAVRANAMAISLRGSFSMAERKGPY